MILDFLTTCASIIKINHFNILSNNMQSNNYNIKSDTDIKSWKLTSDSVSSVHFLFMSANVKKLKEISYNLVGSQQEGDIVVKIETSLDYVNWTELNYVVNSKAVSGLKYIYKKIKGSAETYYYNTTTKLLESPSTVDVPNLRYSFTKTNEYNKNVDYLYDNLEWKFIKISLDNIPSTLTSPLFFSHLKIYIDEELDSHVDKRILELNAPIFTKPKIFDEYEFVPDLVRNFMKMLEEKNTKISDIHYVGNKLCEIEFPKSTNPEGIGNDFIDYDTVVYS